MFKTVQELELFLENIDFQSRIDFLAKKEQRIIVFGAGSAFSLINKCYDLSRLNIVGISDSRFKNEREYLSYKVIDSENLSVKDFDLILIGSLDTYYIKEFFEAYLIPKIGKFKYEKLVRFSLKDKLKHIADVLKD